MLNGSNISKGTWTWMSRNQKSVVDYCLKSQEMFPKVNQMWIDDTGAKWETGTDHNMMQIGLKKWNEVGKKKMVVEE